MNLNALTAISPVDGRYRKSVKELAGYFSEYALIRYRVRVEIEYFIALCELPLPQLKNIDKSIYTSLRNIYQEFSEEDAHKIKDIEKVTNHDVKAVEYFIKEKFDTLNLESYKEFIHFGLTSQDINNTSVPLSLKEAVQEQYLPQLEKVISKLKELSTEWSDIPLLARTHGPPASPRRRGAARIARLRAAAHRMRSTRGRYTRTAPRRCSSGTRTHSGRVAMGSRACLLEPPLGCTSRSDGAASHHSEDV